jgi:hypothetical protein
VLRYNLKTVHAYLLKEAFQQLWDYESPAWAGKFLDEWCRQRDAAAFTFPVGLRRVRPFANPVEALCRANFPRTCWNSS